MNRSPWLLLLALAFLGAAPAPTPLVTGSVRDASGRAIEGAAVSARDAAGLEVRTTTDADGTFVLEADGVRSVTVACRFCRTLSVRVGDDGTAIAVVKRYDALAFEGATREDLARLPYAHVASSLALTPFTILQNSTGWLPGAQLSDRIAANGGLVVNGSVPQYDIVAGMSPFFAIPDRYVQNADVMPRTEGFIYGNLADNGTFVLDPRSEGTDAAVSVGGAGAASRAGMSNDALAASAGASADALQQQRQADAQYAFGPGEELDVVANDGRRSDTPTRRTDASFVGVSASAERTQAFTMRVQGYADRGSYSEHYSAGSDDSGWSDAGGSVLLASNAAVAPFASFGVRNSAGFYAASFPNELPFAGDVTQSHEIFGMHASARAFDVTAAFGGYDIAYAGGAYGKHRLAAYGATPLLHARWTPGAHWSVDVATSGGFSLPTLSQEYGSGVVGYRGIDRDATDESTLEYTDASRIRAAATAVVRNTNGPDRGRVAGLGGSAAWQIAPTISVRAWWLHETPTAQTYVYNVSRVLQARGANVGSLWLAYASPLGLTADAIWRQDVLNGVPDAHLDASVAGPLAPRVRWFVGTERYLGVRQLDLGLRLSTH